MSNIVIEDFNRFESIINDFNNMTNKLSDLLKNENNSFNSLSEKNIWQGDLHEILINKYTELSTNYETIINSLNGIENFMRNTLEEYKLLENSLNNDLSYNANNLDFNN